MDTKSAATIGILLLGVAMTAPAAAQPYEARQSGDIVQLEDKASRTVVSIITSVGNMAYEMRVNGHNILRFPYASIDDFRARPARVGIPLLAPWGNRLDEQAFFANGKRYAFDMQSGNITGAIPIHGFMSLTDQWQIVELKHDDTAAWLTSRLDAYKQPAWMKQWPFAHTIEMTYRLQAGVLEVRTKVVNLSAEPMPVALGYHPWLQLTDSPRDEWTITVPARTRWLLSHQKVPTGVTEPTGTFFTDFTGALKDYNIDDVFTDLVRDAQGRVTTTVKGRSQQIELAQGPNFKALIVYSPNPLNTGRGSQIPPPDPNAQAAAAAPAPAGRGAAPFPPPAPPSANPLATPNFICIEPMAGITNALNLAHRGVYKELQSIPPGGTWQESFWIKPSGF
ncbi:MAG: aldose 1-epimerase [Vicinamibacterales bacterium]